MNYLIKKRFSRKEQQEIIELLMTTDSDS